MKTLLVLFILAAAAVAEPGATVFSTGQVGLGATGRQVAPAGTSRQRAVLIRNLDASISIYVGTDASVTSSTGMLLKAGESITINTRAAVHAVAASGSPVAAFLAESD